MSARGDAVTWVYVCILVGTNNISLPYSGFPLILGVILTLVKVNPMYVLAPSRSPTHYVQVKLTVYPTPISPDLHLLPVHLLLDYVRPIWLSFWYPLPAPSDLPSQ